jgi:hypothetical protein
LQQLLTRMEIVYQTSTTAIIKRAVWEEPKDFWKSHPNIKLFINVFAYDLFIPPYLISRLEEFAASKAIYVIIETTFDKPIIKMYIDFMSDNLRCKMIKCTSIGKDNIITALMCNLLFNQLILDQLCAKCHYFSSDTSFCAVNPYSTLTNNTCKDFEQLTPKYKCDILGLPL